MKYKAMYIILPGMTGKTVWTKPPPYDRAEGGKFVLNDHISQRDLQYLYDSGEQNKIGKYDKPIPEPPVKKEFKGSEEKKQD